MIEESGLKFQIDKNNNKAKVKFTSDGNGGIFIPRFVKKGSKEYPIVELFEELKNKWSNKVTSVDFPEDSEVQTINQNAFRLTKIEKLFIPASVKELKEGWCSFTSDLNRVIVSPNNSNFSNFTKDIIIGKSTLRSEIFDSLYFASRKISQIKIPSFIKRIAPYAFSNCKNLKFVDFQEDSSLEVIGNNSFSESKIISITIPKHVKIIGKNAFEYCSDLSKINISDDSELESICSHAFANTIIDHLYFPANLKELQGGWCKSIKKLHSITISPKNKFFTIIDGNLIVGKSNPNIDDYDILYLALPGLTSLTLPSNIKKINDYAFIKSKKMKFLNFPDDSKLEIIGKFAFFNSNIKSIDIPKSVTIIDDYAFNRSNLEIINFTDDSSLKIIGESSFRSSSLTSINIPKHVSEIKDNAFNACYELKEILFCDDAEIENIGQFAFRNTSIRTFEECRKLEEISFVEPSKTTCIENSSFSRSSIKRITFPSSLSKIEKGWNKNTNSLINIDIPKDSDNFKIIDNNIIVSNLLSVKSKRQDSDDEYEEEEEIVNNDDDKKQEEKLFNVICFAPRNIKEVKIPNYIKYIDSYAFSKCDKLEEVYVSKETELEELRSKSFSSTSITTIYIPKSVKIIGNKCFSDCSELKSIKFADNSQLEVIGKKAFSTIPIENISIPNSVKIIQKEAFMQKDLISSSKITEISSISDDSQLQCINESVFNIKSLKTFKIPNQVKVIKNAFKYCYDLENINISEDSELTTIENDAFKSCSLKSFYFPPLLHNSNDFLYNLSKLTKISISPKNKNYSTIKNGKIILGKTDIKNDDYDVLLYSIRDIESVIIPSYIKKINSNAFKKCELRTVKFEENSQLEIIGKKSFKKSSIRDIEIPDSVKIIDDCAFSKCRYLQEIKISNNSKLNFIGKKAFCYTDFDKIFIPQYVEVIDKDAFMYSQLEFIRFSDDSLLKTIGSSSFYNSKIYHITIPKHVKEIEVLTFGSCKDFSHLEFEEDSELQIIHHDALYGSKISKLNFPPKLSKLENGWSSNVKNLRKIKISEKNEKFAIIDKKMIVEKSNPNSNQFDVLSFVMRDADCVTIPSYIKIIRSECFSYCDRLKEIKFAENSELEIIEDYAFYYTSCESNLIIPKSVKIIEDHAFSHFKNASIEFQDGSLLEQIGKNAFYDCNIEKFVFQNKMKFVTFNIFEGCRKIKEIQMSDNVELIDPFIDFKLPIETINIPAKVDEFKIIYSLPSLSKISISPNNKYFDNFEGKLIMKKTNPNNDVCDTIYYAMPNIGDITIPSCFTKIDSSIFSHKNIGKVSFLDDSLLKIIKDSAFDCSTITEICIPKHVKVIGSRCFKDCSNLKKIEFVKDSELEIIKSESFEDSSLTTIDIPKNVKIIEHNAFYNSKLQVINFTEDSKLEFIGHCAFNKTSIIKIKIPKNVKILKSGTFAGCSKLEEVTFVEPSKISCIEGSLFSRSSIKRITFPSSLSKIEKGWNKNTNYLNYIDIPKDNNNFKIIDNNIIIANSLAYYDDRNYCIRVNSSDEDNDDDDEDLQECDESSFKEEEDKKQGEKLFNVICFAPRNIKEVRIPNYIKYIDSYAFSKCDKLKEVYISKETELEELRSKSFSSTSITTIYIPKSVKIIGYKCFSKCEKLTKFEIDCDHNQEISIYKDAFASTALRSFSFPKGFISYDTDLFKLCESLKSIEFLCDSEFELSRYHLFDQVFLISFPNATKIKIHKSRYASNKKEITIFSIPFVEIEYDDFE